MPDSYLRSYSFALFMALMFHGVLLFYHPFLRSIAPAFEITSGVSSLEIEIIGTAKTSVEREENKTLSSLKKINEAKSAEKEKVLRDGVQNQNHSQQAARAGAFGALNTSRMTPSYIHNPQPSYPEEERSAGHQGTVRLRVAVNEEGKVMRVTIEHSSGYSRLDERARETVLNHWQFQPAHSGNQTVASELLLPIHFLLK